MKKIFSLTNIFVKEFYQSIPIFDKEKNKFNKKSIFFWLIAIIFIGVTYLSYEIIRFLLDLGQPEIFLDLYFFILAILILFQTILVSANIFFFSRDIEKVLHMPLKPVELLLAKFNTLLCMLYVSEGIVGVVPLTLYGLLTQANLVYYLWEIIILAIFPILLAAGISIILLIIMRFAKFIRNKDVFQVIITVIMLVLLCILQSKLINGMFAIQSDEQAFQTMSSLSEKAERYGKYFLVVNPSIEMLKNSFSIEAIKALIELIICTAIGGGIFLVIGKNTYLKDVLRNMTSYTNKKIKKIDLEKDTKCRSIGKAYIIKEIKMLIREPIYLMQCVFPVLTILVTIIMLVVIFIPIVLQLMQDETLKESLQEVINGFSVNTEVVCNILIVLQVLFSISNISLTAVSREGKNAEFMKYIPVTLYKQFIYKNIPQIALNLIVSIAILGLIWYVVPSINVLYLFLIFVISIFTNIINSYVMMIVDFKRPNLNWNTEYAVVKNSDNKIFQYAFFIINVLFLMYIARVLKDANILFALIAQIVVFAVIFVILDRCVKRTLGTFPNKNH